MKGPAVSGPEDHRLAEDEERRRKKLFAAENPRNSSNNGAMGLQALTQDHTRPDIIWALCGLALPTRKAPLPPFSLPECKHAPYPPPSGTTISGPPVMLFLLWVTAACHDAGCQISNLANQSLQILDSVPCTASGRPGEFLEEASASSRAVAHTFLSSHISPPSVCTG